LVESKRNPHYKSILDSTHGILLFGTPQQGIRTEELERVVGVHSAQRHNLILQLKEGSAFLENQREDLLPMLETFKEWKVVSFYETMNTPSVRKMPCPAISSRLLTSPSKNQARLKEMAHRFK